MGNCDRKLTYCCNLPQDTRHHVDSGPKRANGYLERSDFIAMGDNTREILGILGLLLGPTPFAKIGTNIGETQNSS